MSRTMDQTIILSLGFVDKKRYMAADIQSAVNPAPVPLWVPLLAFLYASSILLWKTPEGLLEIVS